MSCTIVVLDSDGNSFSVTDAVLDSDGNSFTVGVAANDSDGNSFTVGTCASAPAATVTGGGIGHGGKKRRRYIIKERVYLLDEAELQQVLAIAYKTEEPVEVAKPTKKLVKKIKEKKVEPRRDESGFIYYAVPRMSLLTDFVESPDADMVQALNRYMQARKVSDYLRWLDEDDEEIAILLAA